MTWWTFAAAIVAASIGGGGIGSLLKLRHDKQLGISEDKREDRAQVATASESLIGLLMKRVDALEARCKDLENGRIEDQDYIELLREHISSGSPPPPPPRPPVLTPAS